MKSVVLFILAAFCVASISAQSQCNQITGPNSNATLTVVLDNLTANLGRNNLVQYFNGQKPTGSFNYVANGTALAALKASLVNFFQSALGCNDSSVRPYTGPTNLAAVHAAMQISRTDYNAFNQIIYEFLGNLSVTTDRINFVRGTVNTLYNAICQGPGCQPPSICDKYSSALALANVNLVGVLVDGAVANVTSPSNPLLRRFFDGSLPGTINYTAGGVPLTNLRNHLITFFAQAGVLTCTDGSVGPYTGRTMRASHANLPIGLQAFNSFNAAVAGVAAAANVSPADVAAVAAVLETLKVDICNQPDCNPVVTTSTGSASSLSFMAPITVALAALTYFF